MRDTGTPDSIGGAASSGRPLRSGRWLGAASTPSSVTGPADYALINLTFLAGLYGVARIFRRREREAQDALRLRELPVFGVAAFAMADVLAKQKVTTWLREPFVEESADHRPVRPEGSGLRYALGELLMCTRCVGAWCALGLIGLRAASPPAGRAVSGVLATAGANHFLQVSFSLLSQKANKASADAAASLNS